MWLEGVFPNNTHANCWDRSNATAGPNRAWREWQAHAEDLASSWKCKVRQVSVALWCEISNGFWGFSSLRLLCLSLFHPLFNSWFCAELSIHGPSLPVCALWTPQTILLKGRVIKLPFMQARALWWGCHFVQCYALSPRTSDRHDHNHADG